MVLKIVFFSDFSVGYIYINIGIMVNKNINMYCYK